MKKIFVTIALVSLCLADAATAQNTKVIVADPPVQHISFPTERHSVDVYNIAESNREVVYCSDFSIVEEWDIETNGQGAWELLTETPEEISQLMGIMASGTADNGFGAFNGIQWLFNPPVMPQESTLTCNVPIDCSALTDVIVTFYQMYRAYNVDHTFFDVSIDGGNLWTSHELNYDVLTNAPAIQGNISLNISAVAAGQPNVMVRFRWFSDYIDSFPEATQEDIDSYGSGYMWLLDDICISSPPENEISIGTTWYQNFFEIQEQESYADVDLINAAEYHVQPYHSLRPFNFACVVSNSGTMDQTNVRLIVTVTDADGTTNATEISSPMGFTLPAGETDTLRAYGEEVDDIWHPTATSGTFTIDFEVVQDQVDELPGNNIGVSLFTRISNDDFTGPVNGGGAVESHNNSNTITANTADWNLEENAIHGNRYTFDLADIERTIVAIQFALNSSTLPGEQILLNLRKGSVLEEESPENTMELFFSYDDEEIVYITNADDFTDDSNPVWITQELPYPVLIEPNTIHQPEIMIPASAEPFCRIGATLGRTNTIGVFYYFAEPSDDVQGWYAWSTLEYNLRLVTGYTTGTDDITVENGIKLTQNYPNPFTDQTRIQYQFDETSTAALEVYDLSGKLVYSDDLGVVSQYAANSYMFNRGSLAPGVYTYSIVTKNNRVTRKMTIE